MKDMLYAIGSLGFFLTVGATPFLALLFGLKPEPKPAAPDPPRGFWSSSGALVVPGRAEASMAEARCGEARGG